MKINLGCGSTPLKDYTNVDMDTLEDLRERYPNRTFEDDLVIEQWDIFNLPVEDGTVDEVRADCLFEHLNFIDEKRAFYEVKRVLKPGGVFTMRTWGEYVPEVLRVSKSLGFMVVKNERGFYEDDYKEDYVDMRMLKSMRSL